MTVTVGRIEYVVGADGHILEKEARDVARKAGKSSGKTFSDDFDKSVRDNLGKASGFENALDRWDKEALKQFREMGGFHSKAYAKRFEENLRPQYQQVAKKLIGIFNKMTADGTVIDLSKNFNFKGGDNAAIEAQVRRTKELMDELAAAMQLGVVDKPAGFNAPMLEDYRKALERTITTMDAEKAALDERAKSLDKVATAEETAAKWAAKYATLSDEEINNSAHIADAQEKELAARLRNLEAQREQAFARVDSTKEILKEKKALEAAGPSLDDVARRGKTLAQLQGYLAKSVKETESALQGYVETARHLDTELQQTQLHYDDNIRQWEAVDHVVEAVGRTEKKHVEVIKEQAAAVEHQVVVSKKYEDTVRAVTEEVVKQLEAQKSVAAVQDKVTEKIKETVAVTEKVVQAEKEHTAQEAKTTASSQKAADALQAKNDRLAESARKSDEAKAAAQRLDVALARVRENIGDGQAWERLVKNLGSVDAAFDHTQGRISAFHAEGAKFSQVEAFSRRLTNLAEKSREVADTADDAADGIRKIGKASQAAENDSGGFFKSIKNFLQNNGGLSTGAIIGLVAGAIEPLTVLVSGASAAIVGLVASAGAALGGLAAIAGPAIAGLGFTVLHAVSALKLMKEEFPAAQKGMDALAKAAKNDSRAFARAWGPALADFTNTLAELWTNDKMGERAGQALGKVTQAFTKVLKSPAYHNFQTAMETTIPDSIANIGTAAAGLSGGLLNIFAAAAPSLDKLTRKLAQVGTTWEQKVQKQFESGELQDAIDSLIDSLTIWLTAIGKIGGALKTLFDKGKEYGDRMVISFGNAFDAWDKWMRSVDGSRSLDQFFSGGQQIFDSLLDQLPKIGRFFDQIVTQDAIDRTTHLLDTLGDIVEGPLVNLTKILGELDPFGVLADALLDIGNALKPLQGPMEDLAAAIKDILGAGIDRLADFLEDAATALAPFVQGIADFLAEDPQLVADVILAIAAAFVIFKGAQGIQGVAGKMQGFIGQMDDATKKAPTWQAGISGALAGILLALPASVDGEVTGMDIVGSIGAGMVAGAAVGGPLGAAVGALGAALTTMIADMFDAVHGPWNNGWDQLFKPGDYSGAGIGELKRWFAEELTPVMVEGWANAVAGYAVTVPQFFTDFKTNVDTGGAQVTASVEQAMGWIKDQFVIGWEQIVGYFSVTLPGFFQHLSASFLAGFLGLASSNIRGWVFVGEAFKAGWAAIANWWNNELPRFWSQAGANLMNGIRGLGDWVARGFQSLMGIVRSWVATFRSAVSDGLSHIPGIGSLFKSAAGSIVGAASGMVLRGPQILLAGEAGPEAIVPLRRPLSQVDPAVRWLSAVAQGKAAAPALGGGVSEGGGGRSRIVNIAPGAIVVQGSLSPEATATATVNRIAERIAG